MVRWQWDLTDIDAEIGIAFALASRASKEGRPNILIGEVLPAEDWVVSHITRLMLAGHRQLPKVMEAVVDDAQFLDTHGPFAKYDSVSQKEIAQSTRRGMGLGKRKCSFELCYFMRPLGSKRVEPRPASWSFQADDWLIWLGSRLMSFTREQQLALASPVTELIPIVRTFTEAVA